MANKFSKITNRDQWQNLLDKALFKTFFHNLAWEEFLEKELKWLKFEHYNYQDLALLSLARVKGKLVSHPFCEYGGPLPLVGKIDGQEFKTDLFSEFKEKLKINLHPELAKFGFSSQTSWRNTYLIENLSQLKEEDLLASLRYDIRHSIKEAEGQGFIFEECNNPQDLKRFYNLYCQTVRRHKNIPLPFSFFEFFSRSAKIYLLKSGEKIATGSVFLPSGSALHYFITAADSRFRRQGVNQLLLWHVLKKHLGGEYSYLDLGATRKGSSLEEFKRGWRGKELPIVEITNMENSLRQSKLRNILGFLPVCLMKKAGKQLLKYKF
jgi:hypothetical protein